MNTQNISPQLNKLMAAEKLKGNASFNSSSDAFVSLLESAMEQNGPTLSDSKSGTVTRGWGYALASLLSSSADGGEGMMMLMAALSAKNPSGIDLVQRRQIIDKPTNQNAANAAQAAYQHTAQDAAVLNMPLVSPSGNTSGRSAYSYRSTINKFNVEENRRYAVNQKGTGDTYCNIFVTDVTRAMGAEIPHFIDKTNGKPLKSSKEPNAMALTANRMNDWLNTYGPQYGWRKTTPERAQHYANQGRPAITSWRNSFGHGHIQMVSPSQNGAYDPKRGVAIAQAGRKLINYGYIEDVYRTSNLKNIEYFVHD